MPPTVNPSPCATACFVRVSVVRIASAAAAPPSAESAVAAAREAGEQLVERQRHADHAGREHEHLLLGEPEQPRRLRGGRPRVALALLAGGRVRVARVRRPPPAAARSSRCSLRDDDRRRLHPVDGEHAAPVAGTVERTSARSLRRLRIPQCTPLATNPLAAVTLTPTPRASRSPAVSSSPSARFAFCTAWPAAPLPRLSSAQIDDRLAGGAVLEHAELGGVRPLDARELRRDAVGQEAHDARPAYASSSRARSVVGVGRRVAGDEQPAAHGQQVRDEADREAERLLDLGRVLVRPDAVRRDVLEHEAGVRRLLQRRAPRPRRRTSRRRRRSRARAGLRAGRARAGWRSRSSPGSRSAGPVGGPSSGHRVAPLAERVRRAGARSRTTPRRAPASVRRCAPERSTTTPSSGGSSAAASSWPRQRKTTSAPARSASSFGTNAGRCAVQPHVERRGGLARERVGAERDQLRAPGARAGGRASPGRRTRRRPGWLRSASA